ncbi:unnamed protein product [Peronospora farinosa]|uniref:EGF-like domain-containing protein n=1 Tax=Peronospora farinosa TaxID=134698 RepID=A0AAV0USQ0_9STRA|nr:unnamed protein product [Peronospora farinosa]CAI5739951.1 unnamed protein product [Peronospora farinosa]
MRVVMAMLLLVLQPRAKAMHMAISCTSTAECSDGETCVAGDSMTPIQYCVAGTACGGSTFGSCPSDTISGQLACIKHLNIYKCLSIDRCDEYFGNSLCSGDCNVDGVQCNGKGLCSLMSTSSEGAPSFGCTCNDGFSGDKCETESNLGSKIPSSSAFQASSSTDSSFSEASPTSSSLDFTSSPTDMSTLDSSSTTSSTSGSTSKASNISTSPTAASIESDNGSTTQETSQSGSSGPPVADSDSGGTSSAVFIIIGILAAIIIVGALMFAMYSRKKKREQEAEAGGFGEPGAIAAGGSETFRGTGPDTPKSRIVIM